MALFLYSSNASPTTYLKKKHAKYCTPIRCYFGITSSLNVTCVEKVADHKKSWRSTCMNFIQDPRFRSILLWKLLVQENKFCALVWIVGLVDYIPPNSFHWLHSPNSFHIFFAAFLSLLSSTTFSFLKLFSLLFSTLLMLSFSSKFLGQFPSLS